MTENETAAESGSAGDAELPAIEEILPHRRGMLFLESVTDYAEDRAAGRARIPPALCGGDEGTPVVPVVLAMEMAAQLAAFHASMPAWRSGEAARDRGFLVRLTKVECERPTLEMDVPLDVRVELTGSMSRLAMYRVEVGPDGAPFVRGRLNIMSGG